MKKQSKEIALFKKPEISKKTMEKIDVIFIEIKRLLETKEWNYIDSFTRHFTHNGHDISIHIKPPKNGNRKSSPKRGQS